MLVGASVTQRGRGERVASNPRLRFGDASEKWLDQAKSRIAASTMSSSAV